MATTESMFPDQSDFHYDYETLRTTGVILAIVMFVSGILIALKIPTLLEPQFQRQKFLLRLYRRCRACSTEKNDVITGSPRANVTSARVFAEMPFKLFCWNSGSWINNTLGFSNATQSLNFKLIFFWAQILFI
ncbi:FXYD domain containing ion transport regulator 7 [Kryptolebias marmoratus]|uniref:FXYD domain containing ion transport regulator 7 n=1 Tax=Kryptolebias marmoratus TaxID=37003 RepID=UPI0018AD004A|nr:FXYD domain containing ion transport regulator 7 [Kryptolebias marmoratus]